MCQMLAEYLNKTEEALFKTYMSMLMYYTLKMHLCAIFFLPLSFSPVALPFPSTLSCGRQHWAHSHATSICEMVKRFPSAVVCEACSSGSSG